MSQAGEFWLWNMEAQLNRVTCLQQVTRQWVITRSGAYRSAATAQLHSIDTAVAREQMPHILAMRSEHTDRLGR